MSNDIWEEKHVKRVALPPTETEQAEFDAKHDPRCISLTESEFNCHCDCTTLRMLDQADGPMRCPGCDCDPVGMAPHNGRGDCRPDHADGSRDA